MIEDNSLSVVGQIGKTHGVQGDMNIRFDVDVDLDEIKCLFLKMDGINVPFFVDNWRYRSDDTAIVHIQGIETEPDARKLFGQTVYCLTEEVATDDDDMSASAYIGYTLIDEKGETIGVIDDFEDSTMNILFHLDNDILIPAQAIEVIKFDKATKQIIVSLPDGLIDL